MSSEMMSSLFLVAFGGAAGSVLRHLVGLAVPFPFGTLTVNIVGSFGIGVLWLLLASRWPFYPLFVTGFLGGFTTFSAFTLDTMRLIEGGRPLQAAGYVGASVGLSLIACLAGLAIGRGLAS